MSDIKRLTANGTVRWQISNGGRFVYLVKGTFGSGTAAAIWRVQSDETPPENIDAAISSDTANNDPGVVVTVPNDTEVIVTLSGATNPDLDLVLRRAG